MFSANAHSVVHYHHEWSAEEEVQLFHAMEGLRPVGINKHFYMSCIAQRLSKSLNREIPSELIWRHLDTMYKLKELDDHESLPFPNEEREFSLPEQDYGALLKSVDTPATPGEEKELSEAAVGSDSSTNGKAASGTPKVSGSQSSNSAKDADKDKKAAAAAVKLLDLPKRPAKRTRGSMSNESISPSTTPPPVQSSKRRRI
ncbi:uncharacterized protein Dwil_GK20940 [Drosophila willistoni]|uniref:MRG-binding protein n=1 Tax=Drosophila willistoni TaxID=7260 RepID=B4MK47_DROWI|nr:MRG/MORF4L-binding protein [Drosophila willistoni]EDW72486.1 uncharacterized protein Dwil_GK20940 [Drosophila willistoni]